MANEHWYALIVRSGFAPIVAQKLRRLDLETFVPSLQSVTSQNPLRRRPPTEYIYCRFSLEDRLTVTNVAGVVDILGIPEPMPLDPRRVSKIPRF